MLRHCHKLSLRENEYLKTIAFNKHLNVFCYVGKVYFVNIISILILGKQQS